MKTRKLLRGCTHLLYVVLCYLFVVAANTTRDLTESKNDEDKGEKIVQKMLEAHGGMQNWLDAPSMSFTHTAHLFTLSVEEGRTYNDNWRYEQLTVEPRSSRGYVVMPLENSARIAVSNGTLWSQGYDQSAKYKNSPLVVMYYQYSFVNLPWLTQLPGVTLEYIGKERLPLDEKLYHTVKMTFKLEGERENKGYYLLYIDPDSFLLKGTKHTAIFPILPGRMMDLNIPAFSNANYRVFGNYILKSGLIVPTAYESYSVDGKELLSVHLITNLSFEKPLDEMVFQDLENTMVKY